MSIRRIFLFLLVVVAFLLATGIPTKSNTSNGNSDPDIIVGRNVNLAPYPTFENGLPVVNSGDPYLQRQNEPSAAVSTRNPMHLLAATNDYRTVYMPFSEGSLPGIELAAQAQDSGDAWVGIFKSYNGGQSWKTHLLPGYPQDPDGQASLLYGYEAACDPTVRAGSSGLFFVSGIGFDRIESGSGIFLARYIDNNTQAMGYEYMDSIEYIDVNMIAEGTTGRFADKPWIAVGAPSNSSDTVLIPTSHGLQEIPRFDVYIVYSIFLGGPTAEDHSSIWIAKSSDCGNSWGEPLKLSASVHVCQGTNVVVSPYDGAIYVVWRQYAREWAGVPDAIVACKSTDGGQTFTVVEVVAEINAYDQWTESDRFRTSAFPAIAVDHNGLVYVAWSERLHANASEEDPGVGRIVIKTSNDGINWDGTYTEIDDHDLGGHQIMPSLAYAGGKLLATWYDTRNSPLSGLPYISDIPPTPEDPEGFQQTMDVRAAQLDPSENQVFGDSVQVSRYIYYAMTNDDGLVGVHGGPVSETNPPVIVLANPDHPNRPIFDGGGSPFMGDYLDSAPSPMFLRDYETGEWRFNTGEGPFDPTLCHIFFASNRDVVPPPEGFTWASYQAPGTGGCEDDFTGMRDQNVYTASITQGIQVYCPVNTKPLSLERSSFLVFVKNLTDSPKDIQLTIDAPLDMDVSFWEFEPPQQPETSEECPFLDPVLCAERIVEMPVLAHSSITLTVFVLEPYYPSDTTFRIKVEEILTGLKSAILLNPDPVNTNLIDPEDVLEYDAPFLITEGLSQWETDVTLFSEDLVYDPVLDPDLLAELLEYANPDVLAPSRRHPSRRHESILNPSRRHTTVSSGPNGQVTDINWTVENTGSATAAYSFDLIGETPSVPYQLLIYRVANTLIPECVLSPEEHHELLLSFEDPSPLSPSRRHEDLQNPSRRHNTFFLAPGEEAVVILRLIDEGPSPEPEATTQSTQTTSSDGTSGESFDPDFYAGTVTGAFIPQAANENGEIEAEAFMWIYTSTLPDGYVNKRWPVTQLEAEGGSGPYIWSLVPDYGNLPPGLELTSAGVIQTVKNPTKGKLPDDSPYEYDEENEVYYKTYNFAVQAEDSTGETAKRSLSIKVICPRCKPPKK